MIASLKWLARSYNNNNGAVANKIILKTEEQIFYAKILQ